MTDEIKKEKKVNHSEAKEDQVEDIKTSEPTKESKAKDKKTDQVKELEEKLTETNEKLARVLADYQNLVRRHREEHAQTIKFAARDFVEMLIQPYDHLRLASLSIDDAGLKMIVDEFMQVLKEQHVAQIVPLGETFDASTMEAVDKTGEGDKVTEVFSPGYMLHDRVIRPARVAVG